MRSGNQNHEKTRRETLLKPLLDDNVTGLELIGDATVRVMVTTDNQKRSAFITSLFKHLIDYSASLLCIEFHVPTLQNSHVLSVRAADMKANGNFMQVVTHPQLNNNMVLKALMNALYSRNISFDYELYLTHLHATIASLVQLKRSKTSCTVKYLAFTCAQNIATLYQFNHNKVMLEANIRYILPLLALDCTLGLSELNCNTDQHFFKNLLNKIDTEQSLLHLFLKYKDHEESVGLVISQLLHWLDNKPHRLLDNLGNTVLHACRSSSALARMMQFVADINATNHAGDTALHQAALDGNFEKYKELLKLGADSEKLNAAGLKPIFLVARSHSQFSMFADCHKYGVGLKRPPFVPYQQGQTCGIYAVFTATNYHWVADAEKSKMAPLHARKRDAVNKNSYSLRRIAKIYEITKAGEMFSATGMAYLISRNGCSSFISLPSSYAAFIGDIHAALVDDYPVIIPFSKDMDSASAPRAYEAHWAVIIGLYKDPISQKNIVVLAHYGGYQPVDAEKLYKGFSQIEDIYPNCYLYKQQNAGWEKSSTKNFGNVVNFFELPTFNLNADFKGRLMTVVPPGVKK